MASPWAPTQLLPPYGGNATYAGSSGSANLTVTSTVAPPYTLAANSTSITGVPSGVYPVDLTLTSSTYAGTVTLTPAVTPANGNVTATLTDWQCAFAGGLAITCTLAAGQTITPTLTITAGASAADHRPMLPWQSGGAVAFGLLVLGAPFTRRSRRALAVLLIASAIVLVGFSLACGGGGGGGDGSGAGSIR